MANIVEVPVGMMGMDIEITCQDDGGNAQDISSYTEDKTVTLDSGKGTLTMTASFVTDGTDGKVKITPAAGDFDQKRKYDGRVTLNKSGVVAPSFTFTLIVK